MALSIRAGTLIIKDRKILLLRNKGVKDQNDKWGPPGGGNLANEKLVDTAIRETKEETNLDVSILGLVEAGVVDSPDGGSFAIAFYLANDKGTSKLKIQLEEASEFVWASEKDIKNDKYPLRKNLLKGLILKAFKGKIVSNDLFQLYSWK